MNVSLNKRMELLGQWWLSSHPERQAPGLLVYEPGDYVRLELAGFLKSPLTLNEEFEYIHGETEAGAVTLEDCVFVERRLDPSRFGHLIGKAFFGFHSSTTKDDSFVSLSIQYSYVNAWAFASGSHELDAHQNWIKSAEVGNWLVQIRLEFPELPRTGLPHGWENRPDVWVDVTRIDGKALSLTEFLEVEHKLRYFFSLIMDRPVFPVRLESWVTASDDDSAEIPGKRIQILLGFSHYPALLSEPLWWRTDVPFVWVWQNWATGVPNWLNKGEQLDQTYHLFFAIRYNPAEYLDSQFLLLTQALEAYHRREIRGSYMSKEEYDAKVLPDLREAIPKAVTGDHRTSLKERLKWGYEFSQRKRFEQVFGDTADRVPVGFLARDRKELYRVVGGIIKARNYMTHFDPIREHDKASTPDLLEMRSMLLLVLEIRLLLIVGIPDDQLVEVINRRHHLPRSASDMH